MLIQRQLECNEENSAKSPRMLEETEELDLRLLEMQVSVNPHEVYL